MSKRTQTEQLKDLKTSLDALALKLKEAQDEYESMRLRRNRVLLDREDTFYTVLMLNVDNDRSIMCGLFSTAEEAIHHAGIEMVNHFQHGTFYGHAVPLHKRGPFFPPLDVAADILDQPIDLTQLRPAGSPEQPKWAWSD